MSVLIPLGLLGLLSIIGLILIYIIKPNYQQKRLSSTYVWKLSLKYKKKHIPISRLSQILLFICQLLILILCAILLAKPAILEERVDFKAESVVILDASASMMVSENGTSRFDVAVEQVETFAKDVMENDGVISVIVAGYEANFLAQRSSSSDSEVVLESLADLKASGKDGCTYGSADIDGAVALAEQVLEINSKAQIILYTATEYTNKNGIKVEKVKVGDEWNVAILDCKATVEDDNYYSISIDVGCYGRSAQITVFCDIIGVNGDDSASETVSKTLFFDNYQEEITVEFGTTDFSSGIFSFKHLQAYVEEDDGFEYDNNYFYYGGQREKIKIQYASSDPNTFFSTTCRNWRSQLKDKWDVEYTILRGDAEPEYEGYDIYIFEHVVPDEIPEDGIVLLFDPDRAPSNAGFRLGGKVTVNSDSTLGLGVEHDITKYVDADNITISSYTKLISADGYDDLLYYANDPILFVKNESDAKIVVCTTNLNFSNIGIRKEFPLIMINLFNYFLPSTITDFSYEIGDTVTLNARGEDLHISGPKVNQQYFTQLPAEFKVDNPGTYTLTQKLINGQDVDKMFYVKVPNFESRITKKVDSLPLMHITSKQEYADKDLIMYFAAALFAIMFVEWLLQAREYFR